MRISLNFILYFVGIHVIMIFLSLNLLPEHPLRFIGAELAIVLSLIFSFRLFRGYLRPLNLIARGIESMKDQDFTTKFVPIGQKNVDQLIEVYNQMMERLRQERVLNQEQNLFLQALIEASPVGVIILDFDGFITNCNPEAVNLPGFGGDEVIAKRLGEIPGALGIALEQVPVGSSEIIRVSGIHMYKCQKAQFIDRGAKRQFLIVEELTEDILESEKNAYGKVIRMMSHEVNNSTGAINSILHTFEKTLKQQNLPDHLEALQVAITRNEHLGQFMKNFAEVIRLPEPQKKKEDIHQLLIQVYTLFAVEAKSRQIQWQWDLDTQDFIHSIDRNQIEQVLVNLVKNAFESMESHGHLCISTRVSERCLIIQDDGPGISPELQGKLFTPFFSTKTQGQGIGLTLVREILLNHGCKFSLTTPEPGCTQFRIEFG